MFIIFRTFLFALFFLFFSLHTFNLFFFLYRISKNIKKIDNLHIFVSSRLQCIINPCVRFTANINKQVTFRNLYHIIGTRLIAVQINALIKKHRQIYIGLIFTKYLPNPIVFGENCCYNAELCIILIIFCCVFIVVPSIRASNKNNCNT